MTKDNLITIRRHWNDWHLANVRVTDIDGLHFSQTSGGVMRRSPRPFLFGYISCDAIVDGEIAHSCRHGQGPHWIKICIVKKDNAKAVYDRLAAMAAGRTG